MERFLDVYRHLNSDNLNRLEDIYTQEIRFVDPAHEILGLDALTNYFKNLYRNIDPPEFRFGHYLRSDTDGYVQWEMDFSHCRLKGGRTIIVPGTSYLRFDTSDKVLLHRDYFDLGAMLYEQLPLLGRIITFIKRRLGA